MELLLEQVQDPDKLANLLGLMIGFQVFTLFFALRNSWLLDNVVKWIRRNHGSFWDR